jgi:hypothetical protein
MRLDTLIQPIFSFLFIKKKIPYYLITHKYNNIDVFIVRQIVGFLDKSLLSSEFFAYSSLFFTLYYGAVLFIE